MPNPLPISPLLDTDAVGVPNAVVLPHGVRQFSCLLDEYVAAPAAWAAFDVPSDLREAPAHRQQQFRAGRYCAVRAIQALEPDCGVVPPPRSANGAPIWPAGITGSITHTHGFTSAAVARTCRFAALGIDTESIMSAAQAQNVSLSVAWACELVEARHAGCDRLQAVTLVFSAKESIFKCLSGSAGFFDFRDVRIVQLDGRAGTFTARIERTLAPRLTARTLLHGQFAIDARRVHTGIAWEAEA